MRTEYKDYYITNDKLSPTCLVIATVGKGGKIPDCLSGLFTSTGVAQEAIDSYLLSKEANGKEIRKNRE